jgi:hypothetical protein
MHRIAADAHATRLPQSQTSQLVHGFVGQRAASRDNADLSRSMNMAWHNADFTLSRSDHAGAVGPKELRASSCQISLDPDHVPHRHPFCDTNNQRNARVRCFYHRIRSERRGDIDDASVRAGFGHRFRDGVKDRNALERGAALSRRHSANHLSPVLFTSAGMKLTGGAGNSLGQDPGLFVYENGHPDFRFWILDFDY